MTNMSATHWVRKPVATTLADGRVVAPGEKFELSPEETLLPRNASLLERGDIAPLQDQQQPSRDDLLKLAKEEHGLDLPRNSSKEDIAEAIANAQSNDDDNGGDAS
jgi:hypothetical protein